MATTVELIQVKVRNQEPHLGLQMGAGAPILWPFSAALQGHQQRVGSLEVEQPENKPVLSWDADVASSGSVCHTTTPNLSFQFLKYSCKISLLTRWQVTPEFCWLESIRDFYWSLKPPDLARLVLQRKRKDDYVSCSWEWPFSRF